MTECIVFIALSLTFVSLLAVILVENIEYLVHYRHGSSTSSQPIINISLTPRSTRQLPRSHPSPSRREDG